MRANLGAEPIADSTRAMLVWEPRRICPVYAVPEEDIAAAVSTAPPNNDHVPGLLQGSASWWSVGGHENLGWSYEEPLPDAVAIAGLVAFWDERVDVFLDGVRRERPGGVLSEVLLDELAA